MTPTIISLQSNSKILPQHEVDRLLNLHAFDQVIRDKGYSRIAGLDEVGRGPLAGPVVVCACKILEGFLIEGVMDSKLLSKKKREQIASILRSASEVEYEIIEMSHEEVDALNILAATKKGAEKAGKALKNIDALLTDALDISIPAVDTFSFFQGDQRSFMIGAASILAKVHRDKLMEKYDAIYPEYGFLSHKGYGTKKHLEALSRYGPCPIHRKTFAPIKKLLHVGQY